MSEPEAANLRAQVGDVDLGRLNGLQFAQSASNIAVAVYANVRGGLLKNFQVTCGLQARGALPYKALYGPYKALSG